MQWQHTYDSHRDLRFNFSVVSMENVSTFTHSNNACMYILLRYTHPHHKINSTNQQIGVIYLQKPRKDLIFFLFGIPQFFFYLTSKISEKK